MTKKKVVVKVFNMNAGSRRCTLFRSFGRQDNRLKALRIAASIDGFQSLSLKGTDRDVIEVTGEGIDAVELTTKLRKNVGHAKLETVEDVKEEKKEEKPKKDEQPAAAPVPVVAPVPAFYVHSSCGEPEPACCTVM